jgi:phytoene/squalene synthetase
LFEEFNEENAKYSDMICSALQLANFWQDISRDKKIGRCYIPKEILKFDGDDINLLAYLENKSKTDEFAKVMNNLRKWTDDLFQEGSKLLNNIKSPRLRLELKAIIAGGRAIVRATAKQGINIYEVRPSINKLRIFINLIFGR